MSWGSSWRPYVPVAQRRASAARELANLGRKTGEQADPVVLAGRAIASSFWGRAWCDHLEAYSDFANRLPRGRTYLRNGSVVDLRIAQGSVTARVCGSELYRVQITIRPLAAPAWARIRTECAGKIDSILELLQGRLSSGVMQIVTHPDQGLFPSPMEIGMKCSCPDWADMCKHVAATLYGVGARLDRQPELLFLLRGVDPDELTAGITGADAVRTAGQARPGLGDADLGAVFGIELDTPAPAAPAPSAPSAAPAAPAAPAKTQSARGRVPSKVQASPPERAEPGRQTKPKGKAAAKAKAKAGIGKGIRSSVKPPARARAVPAGNPETPGEAPQPARRRRRSDA